MISKKILWGLFLAFVSFDNIFSYLAIVNRGMREFNPIVAFFVSINPIYYFISIPLSFSAAYGLIKFSSWLGEKFEKSKAYTRESLERLSLTCLVIGWGIGVTLFNAVTFVRGFSPLRIDWRIFLVTGAALAIFYAFFTDYRMKSKK